MKGSKRWPGWLKKQAEKREENDRVYREMRFGRGEPGSLDPDDFVVVGKANTFGVFEKASRPVFGVVKINVVGITCEAQDNTATITWDAVQRISIGHYDEALSKVLPVALFGVLGLGAKGSQKVVTVMCQLTNGTEAVLVFADAYLPGVRAKFTTTLASVGLRFDEPAAGPSPSQPGDEAQNLADGLERLAALKDRGVLSEAEFAEAKQKLLDRL